MIKKIIHVDMDAFFAQVEQRDYPHYRNRPLVVGSANQRGVVAAASYEARKFGIHSAMPSSIAKKKCNTLIFAPPRFDVYKTVSQQIHEIFSRYTSIIEPLSLDEAYLDVTNNIYDHGSATEIAKSIQHDIYQELNLTASVGVSYNKFLAKIASNMNKPYGITVISPQRADQLLKNLPITSFYGIGQQTAKKMHTLHIKTGGDLREKSREELKLHFGKAGDTYYLFARGQDNRNVDPHQKTRSIGAENTFEKDLYTKESIKLEVDLIIDTLIQRLERKNFQGKSIAIKIRYADFTIITRSKTFSSAIPHQHPFLEEVFWLLFDGIPKNPIRLIGITLQSPDEQHDQQLCIDFTE